MVVGGGRGGGGGGGDKSMRSREGGTADVSENRGLKVRFCIPEDERDLSREGWEMHQGAHGGTKHEGVGCPTAVD